MTDLYNILWAVLEIFLFSVNIQPYGDVKVALIALEASEENIANSIIF